MGQTILKIFLELIVPILKNFIIYKLGQNAQKKEEELKDLEQENKENIKEKEIIKEQKEVYEKISDDDINDIYNQWLFESKNINKK